MLKLALFCIITAAMFAGCSDDPPANPTGGRYDVTAHALGAVIITDHQTNTLYIYTEADDDENLPDESLSLQGMVDLNQVGQPHLLMNKAENQQEQ